MKAEDLLLKQKMSLLQLAEQLNNIRHACNIFGVILLQIKYRYGKIRLKD